MEYFLILAVTYISISVFAFSVFNPRGITNSAIKFYIWAIAAEFKQKFDINERKIYWEPSFNILWLWKLVLILPSP